MRILVLTDRRASEAAGRPLATTVREAVAGGADAVLLREKDLDASARRRVGEEVAAALGPASLVVASDTDLAHRLGAVGVHLAQRDRWPHAPGGLTVGRSCHDAAEVAAAAGSGAGYATVSPVWATPSKPGHGPALGPDGLGALANGTDLALFALGGVTPERVPACLGAGAAGVAVMGAVMGSADPAATVAALVVPFTHARSQEVPP